MPRKPKQTEEPTVQNEIIGQVQIVHTEEQNQTVTQEPLRYTYLFRDEITKESVQGLIDVLAQHQAVDLFFTTEGGEMSSMNMLIYYINNHPDICIFLTEYIASAGTLLLVDCMKPVIVTEDLEWILFHKIDRGTNGQFRKQLINEKQLYKQTKKDNKKLLEKIQHFLTEKEIKKFKSGRDAILYQKDFQRLKSDNVMLIEEILSEDYEGID